MYKKGNNYGALNKGRKRMPQELIEAKQLTRDEFLKATTELLRHTPQSICNIVNDPRSDALTCLIGTIIVKAIDEGDDKRASFIIENTIGKAKETKDINLTPIPPIILEDA